MEFEAVSEAFARARRLEGGARADFLAELDSAIRREVEDLLGHHESPDAPALEPVWESLASLAAGEQEPPELSGFRIVRRLGAGGMGTVYEAEQLQPHRRVAIKLLHLSTAEGRRRFEREAQVLAELHHPGIAAIHAQGVTKAPGGELPYLVMEYVDGVPLTEYARGLDERARIQLLVRVCDAVAHAHEHGVIHRDLKPANILVRADGEPKVLDFGLARVMGGDSLRTRTGHVLGTLSYMSPEQAIGTPQAADTRSDVYALGVIAYEMIRGEPPYDLGGLTLPAAAQKLLHEDAPSLPGGGDLAHIVAKSLSKEKARRYATAAALGDDLRRYLADESVVARAPTAGDQIGRLLRRHKALVLGVGATMLALAVGLVFALRFAHEATLEGRRARRSAAVASLQAAAAAERDGQIANLARHLEAVPPDERGWEWRFLHARRDRSVGAVSIGNRATHARLSDDGSRLLFAGVKPRGVFLVSTDDGAGLPLDLGGTGLFQRGLGFSGQDPLLVGVRDGQFVLVNGATGSSVPLAPFVRGHFVSRLAISPDGNRVAWVRWIGQQTSRVDVHEIATGRRLRTIVGDPVVAEFGAGGRTVVTGGSYANVRVDALEEQRRLADLSAHTQTIEALALHPGGRYLASASLDQSIAIWDLEERRLVRRLRGHSSAVRALAYGPDGARLVSGDGAGTLRVWNSASGECEWILGGHTSAIKDVRFRDRVRIVSGTSEEIRHWSLAVPEVLRAHRKKAEGNRSPYVYGVAYSPDGTRLASAGWDKTIRIYDAATRRQLLVIEFDRAVYSVTFSPDGREVAGGGKDIRIFDVGTGKPLRRFALPGSEPANRLRFTPAGGRLLAAASSATCVLDAKTGAVQARWESSSEHARLALSPDARTLADSHGKTVRLHALEPGGRQMELEGNRGHVFDLAFSPDGRLLATAGSDRTVRLFDLASGTERFCLRGHTSRVYAVAFSPDGTRLFSGSDDSTVRVWDVLRGEERLELRGHEWYVYDLAVHPDGHTVASASGDNTVRLWSTLSDRELVAEAGDG